ncbi:MAG: right-handed parallel beta-helix repeat-containing protein [Planctomycetota bacterium]|jgi:hypothetical protein
MRLLVSIAAATILAASSPAMAGKLKVPQKYDTIQDAVDAAQDGDTILVSKGVYRENVVVDGINNLKFIGKKAVWDGYVNGEEGICLEVSANGTLVKGFKFRNADDHIYVEGNDTVVTKCSFTNAEDAAVEVYGDRTKVSKVTCRGNDYDLYATEGSDDTVWEKNTCRQVYEDAIYIEGDRTIIQKNSIRGSYGGGIHCHGDDSLVTMNTTRNIDGNHIDVSGNGNVVTRNSSRNGWSVGIDFHGEDGLLADNDVRASYDYAIYVTGTGHSVTGNMVTFSYSGGMQCDGDNLLIDDNVVEDILDGQGLRSSGNGNEISHNYVAGVASEGLLIQGTDFIVHGNDVMDVWDSYGISINDTSEGASTSVVTDNFVSDTTYWGLYVEGAGPLLEGNLTRGTGTRRYGGFYISAHDARLVDNYAEETGTVGFYISGNRVTLDDCHAEGEPGHGFVIDADDAELDDCSALGCGAHGLLNVGSRTSVMNSIFLDNGIDVANGGDFENDIDTGGNDYETGGDDQDPVYGGLQE